MRLAYHRLMLIGDSKRATPRNNANTGRKSFLEELIIARIDVGPAFALTRKILREIFSKYVLAPLPHPSVWI